MADIPTKEELKQLVDKSTYAVLSARDTDGQAYAFPVYIQPGHYLSFYWLSTIEAQHSQNILNGQDQISGLILDTSQPQGEGIALSFYGVATCFKNPKKVPNQQPFPGHYKEAEGMIRSLCNQSKTLKGKEDILLSPDSPRKLFRVVLTKAWCNGTIKDPKTGLRLDRRLKVPIIQDEAAYIRRYLGDPVLT